MGLIIFFFLDSILKLSSAGPVSFLLVEMDQDPDREALYANPYLYPAK